MRAPPRGFTLVEILLSITLLAILFSIALPRLGEAERRISLREQAEQVASLLCYARNLAVFSGSSVILSIDPDASRFELDVSEGEPRPDSLRLNPGGPLFLPHSLELDFDQNPIRFAPTGVTDPFEIALSDGTRRITLRSDDYSGKPDLTEMPSP